MPGMNRRRPLLPPSSRTSAVTVPNRCAVPVISASKVPSQCSVGARLRIVAAPLVAALHRQCSLLTPVLVAVTEWDLLLGE